VWGAGREIQYTVQEVKQIYNNNKTLSHAGDLIRQADLEKYRDQVEPTRKAIIAEVDDIKPNFRKSRRA